MYVRKLVNKYSKWKRWAYLQRTQNASLHAHLNLSPPNKDGCVTVLIKTCFLSFFAFKLPRVLFWTANLYVTDWQSKRGKKTCKERRDILI